MKIKNSRESHDQLLYLLVRLNRHEIQMRVKMRKITASVGSPGLLLLHGLDEERKRRRTKCKSEERRKNRS